MMKYLSITYALLIAIGVSSASASMPDFECRHQPDGLDLRIVNKYLYNDISKNYLRETRFDDGPRRPALMTHYESVGRLVLNNAFLTDDDTFVVHTDIIELQSLDFTSVIAVITNSGSVKTENTSGFCIER